MKMYSAPSCFFISFSRFICVSNYFVKCTSVMVYDHRVDLHKENKSAKIKQHSLHNRSSYRILSRCFFHVCSNCVTSLAIGAMDHLSFISILI